MFRLAAHDNQQPGNHFLEIPTGETKGEKVLRKAIGANGSKCHIGRNMHRNMIVNIAKSIKKSHHQDDEENLE